MLIYDALKKDHDTLKPLLERLVNSADADAPTRKKLIEQIRDELIPHARAEEAVFYNSLRTIDGAKELVAHGYTEHMEAEAMLRTLQAMEMVDANWTKVAKKLKDGIEHHIEEEEGKIFTAAKQVLAEEEAEVMADVFETMKPEIREGGFVSNTMEMIVNMMPVRFSEPLRAFLHRPQ
jgi:hemerythrin-like domain-containing protein